MFGRTRLTPLDFRSYVWVPLLAQLRVGVETSRAEARCGSLM
jgi:hypothetical protein